MPCIIVLYNGCSEAPIRLSGRRRSCLVYTKPKMFRLGMVPKEIHSRLFNPVCNQTCTWKHGYGRHCYVRKKPLWKWIYRITQKYELFAIFVQFSYYYFYNFSYILTLHHCFYHLVRFCFKADLFRHVHYISFRQCYYTFCLRQ